MLVASSLFPTFTNSTCLFHAHSFLVVLDFGPFAEPADEEMDTGQPVCLPATEPAAALSASLAMDTSPVSPADVSAPPLSTMNEPVSPADERCEGPGTPVPGSPQDVAAFQAAKTSESAPPRPVSMYEVSSSC